MHVQIVRIHLLRYPKIDAQSIVINNRNFFYVFLKIVPHRYLKDQKRLKN